MLKQIFLFTLTMFTPLFAEYETLIETALQAREQAYAPYSKYQVGAALMTKNGKIIPGCNVENASYGLVICAERSAVMGAVSQGYREFTAIVVATKDGGTPCGACRQVLNEFNPYVKVITVDEQGHVTHETTLDQLLPHAFGPQNLQ